MVADIYSMFRRFIGDYTPDYTLPDLETLKFLDLGINKLSEFVDKRVVEDIVISSDDLTTGYKDLTYNYVTIVDTELNMGNKDVYWQEAGGKRIDFIDVSGLTAGTYEFNYKRRFLTFDGEVRENSYFDYPREADLGIVFWALSEYQTTTGIINANGTSDIVRSKSEEGISISYGGENISMTNPTQLKLKAIEIFNGLNNRNKFIYSVSV